MHCFGYPRLTQSMIAYYDFDWVFLENPVKNCIVGMLLTYPIVYISLNSNSLHVLVTLLLNVFLYKISKTDEAYDGYSSTSSR